MRLVALEVVKSVWAIWAIHRRFWSGRRMWIFAGLGGDGNHNNDDLPSLNDLWEGAIRPARRRGSFVAMNNMDGVSSWVSLIVFFQVGHMMTTQFWRRAWPMAPTDVEKLQPPFRVSWRLDKPRLEINQFNRVKLRYLQPDQLGNNVMSPPDPWSLFPRSTAGLTFIQGWQSRNIPPREIKEMQKSLITIELDFTICYTLFSF